MATAPGNAYPAELLQQDGGTLDGIVGIQFTDEADQPGGGGSTGITVNGDTGSVSDVTILNLDGAEVVDAGAGTAEVLQHKLFGGLGTVVEAGGSGVNTLGFYGATPIEKPSVDAATAAAIIQALVNLGLVIDNT